MPNISHNSKYTDTSGKQIPRSHLETDLSLFPSFSEKVHPLMVESCCIQQIFIELPEIAGIESSDFLKAEKAVNHKDQPLRIVIYPKTNIPLPTILCYWNFSRLYISKSYSSVSFHPTASISVHSFQLLCFVFYLPETHLQSLQK